MFLRRKWRYSSLLSNRPTVPRTTELHGGNQAGKAQEAAHRQRQNLDAELLRDETDAVAAIEYAAAEGTGAQQLTDDAHA